jgi:hypothetical protein
VAVVTTKRKKYRHTGRPLVFFQRAVLSVNSSLVFTQHSSKNFPNFGAFVKTRHRPSQSDEVLNWMLRSFGCANS